MKTWQTLLAGTLIGLLAAGLVLLISSPIKGHPITLSPPPSPTITKTPQPTSTPTPIQVQIGGEVLMPGIYALDEKARLSELITLAGGMSSSADLLRINLAAICRDGDYFYIPKSNEIIPETAINSPQNIHTGSKSEFTYPININQATMEELESLPGIGPGKAQEILTYREEKGPFTTIEDLLNVEGIGPKTLEALIEYLIIEE
jgi:competence protein ComEA